MGVHGHPWHQVFKIPISIPDHPTPNTQPSYGGIVVDGKLRQAYKLLDPKKACVLVRQQGVQQNPKRNYGLKRRGENSQHGIKCSQLSLFRCSQLRNMAFGSWWIESGFQNRKVMRWICVCVVALAALMLFGHGIAVSVPAGTLYVADDGGRSAVVKSQSQVSGLIVFTATWYPSTDDLRCRQAVTTLAALTAHGIRTVVVDGSPDESVRDLLASTGALVSKQTAKGKKGAALREAAELAAQLDGVEGDTWLCWQEPEKTDMARHWATAMLKDPTALDAQVAVPARVDANFRRTYPIEQYHSETFGNMYLDAVAMEAMEAQDGQLLPPIDWHFGPFAFRARHTSLWTSFDGEM